MKACDGYIFMKDDPISDSRAFVKRISALTIRARKVRNILFMEATVMPGEVFSLPICLLDHWFFIFYKMVFYRESIDFHGTISYQGIGSLELRELY